MHFAEFWYCKMRTRSMVMIVGVAMLIWMDYVHGLDCYPEITDKHGYTTSMHNCTICVETFFGIKPDRTRNKLYSRPSCGQFQHPVINDLDFCCTPLLLGVKESKKEVVRMCFCRSNNCNDGLYLNEMSKNVTKLSSDDLKTLEEATVDAIGEKVQLELASLLSCISINPYQSNMKLCENLDDVCMRVFAKNGEHEESIPDCSENFLPHLVGHCTPSLIIKNITMGESTSKTATICVCNTEGCNTEEAKKLPVADISSDNLITLQKGFTARYASLNTEIHMELPSEHPVPSPSEPSSPAKSFNAIDFGIIVLAIHFLY